MLTGFNHHMHAVAATLLVLGFATTIARADPPGNKYVQATLLADVSAIQPGKPFTAGVLLKISPGWHIYWKNPGDSGLPTKITWKLPDGWKAGEVRFPLPTRFDLPGSESIIGYEDQVLLMSTLTPPSDLPADQPITLSAEVSWLVCTNICLPGKTTVNLDLFSRRALAAPSPDNQLKPENKQLFAKWRKQLPQKARQGQATLTAGGQSLTARLTLAESARDAQWFCVPPDSSGVINPKVQTAGRTSIFAFELVPPQHAGVMQFLVTFKNADGKRQGVEFTANLPPVQESKSP
jgi:thiol:disulfide interchange protein DsbD